MSRYLPILKRCLYTPTYRSFSSNTFTQATKHTTSTTHTHTPHTHDNHTTTLMAKKCSNLSTHILATSWENYFNLVTDLPIWEAEFERINNSIQPFLYDSQVSDEYKYLKTLFDLVYQLEDVRDDINEVSEQLSRSSGILGIGIFAHEKVENVYEHAEAAARKFDELLKNYPQFKPQINDTVGRGLALLRQKQKYDWSKMHNFFY